MLSRPQQILLKRAQRQAGVSDDEYRDALEHWAGVRSSTAKELTNEHLDLLLSYFEAIYWRAVSAGELQLHCNASEPFQKPGYWASKNTAKSTSRDRFTAAEIHDEIAAIESKLSLLGYGPGYFSAIKNKVIPLARRNMTWPQGLVKYRAALQRTLAAKINNSSRPF